LVKDREEVCGRSKGVGEKNGWKGKRLSRKNEEEDE
jgi:hypothetical protein